MSYLAETNWTIF